MFSKFKNLAVASHFAHNQPLKSLISLCRSFHSFPSISKELPSEERKNQRLQGKIAVITGAGSGIGKATALLFAREGANVVLSDINEKAGREVLDLLKEYGESKAVFIKADVSNKEDVRRMIQTAEDEFGGLSILFNNAGIMHPNDDNAITTTEEVFDKTFSINVKSVFWGCHFGIPLMKKTIEKNPNERASIINTASFVAIMGAATPQIAYTASKGAVLSLSRELAVIHAREGIRVNALCPGPLRTPLLMDFLNTEEKRQRRLVHVPMGRFGEAEEMARAVLFLASDESSYITGSTFLVDGGITSAYVTPL